MNKIELIRKMLINNSIGTSAVRNQGNGIAEVIREKLREYFSLDEFFKKLKSKNRKAFDMYLKELTNKIAGTSGISKNGKDAGKVKWGTARKCINLLLRSIVYNGFIWEKYKLKRSDFNSGRLMDKLELPLDSYAIKGIQDDCEEFDLPYERKKFSAFRIINLNTYDKNESNYFQEKAAEIAKIKGVCRIDLDLEYWRKRKKNNL